MRLYRIAALIVIVALVFPLVALGGDYDGLHSVQRDAGELSKYLAKGTDIALKITELTGVALSPLVGLVVVGGIEHYKAKKEGRPVRWYFSFWFMGVIASILMLITLKDTIGELVPFFKKPLDALDFVQHKFSGIIAFAIVAPGLVLSILEPVGQTLSSLMNLLNPVTAAWAAGSGSGAISGPVGVALVIAIAVSAALAALFFLTVWLAAGAVETLILFSPVPFVGIILRLFRLSIFGLLMLGAVVSPIIGVLFSLVILYVSYRILGWSFRLGVFGWVVALDILGGRRHYIHMDTESHVAAFASPRVRGVAHRSYGRLVRSGTSLVFEYRPFLVLPRRSVVVTDDPSSIGIARGTFYPSVVALTEDHRQRPVLFGLPPRYRGHETEAGKLLGLSPEVHDLRFHRHLRDAWRWIVGQTAKEAPAPGTA